MADYMYINLFVCWFH